MGPGRVWHRNPQWQKSGEQDGRRNDLESVGLSWGGGHQQLSGVMSEAVLNHRLLPPQFPSLRLVFL